MFREAKVLAPKSAAGFKLRVAGTRARVVRHKADPLPQGGAGRERSLCSPSSQLPLPSYICAKESLIHHWGLTLQGNPAPGSQQAPVSSSAWTGLRDSF